MNEEKLQTTMTESNNVTGAQRRRSPRLTSLAQANISSDNKMALGSFAVKRSITVRKIAPRKTVVPSQHDKENTPRLAESEGVQQKKQKVSTPTATAVLDPRASTTPTSGKKKPKAAMPSPILPSTPQPTTQPAAEDAVWSQKVRRSYSRLSEKSFNSPEGRETMFGFEKLETPEVIRGSRTAMEASGPLCGLNSFTSLLEADGCGSGSPPEPDLNIPGVAVVKEKRRRKKKVQQIDSKVLDVLAAQMNAEFEEAAEFQLFVE